MNDNMETCEQPYATDDASPGVLKESDATLTPNFGSYNAKIESISVQSLYKLEGKATFDQPSQNSGSPVQDIEQIKTWVQSLSTCHLVIAKTGKLLLVGGYTRKTGRDKSRTF